MEGKKFAWMVAGSLLLVWAVLTFPSADLNPNIQTHETKKPHGSGLVPAESDARRFVQDRDASLPKQVVEVLSCRVVDAENGAAVSGASVFVASLNPNGNYARFQTNEDGWIRLLPNELDTTRVEVTAWAPGYCPRRAEWTLVDGMEIPIWKGLELRVQVLNSDGSAALGAKVDAFYSDLGRNGIPFADQLEGGRLVQRVLSQVVGVRGSLKALEFADVELRTDARGFADLGLFRKSGLTVAVADASGNPESSALESIWHDGSLRILVLPRRCEFAVRVLDFHGRAVSGAEVVVSASGASADSPQKIVAGGTTNSTGELRTHAMIGGADHVAVTARKELCFGYSRKAMISNGEQVLIVLAEASLSAQILFRDDQGDPVVANRLHLQLEASNEEGIPPFHEITLPVSTAQWDAPLGLPEGTRVVACATVAGPDKQRYVYPQSAGGTLSRESSSTTLHWQVAQRGNRRCPNLRLRAAAAQEGEQIRVRAAGKRWVHAETHRVHGGVIGMEDVPEGRLEIYAVDARGWVASLIVEFECSESASLPLEFAPPASVKFTAECSPNSLVHWQIRSAGWADSRIPAAARGECLSGVAQHAVDLAAGDWVLLASSTGLEGVLFRQPFALAAGETLDLGPVKLLRTGARLRVRVDPALGADGVYVHRRGRQLLVSDLVQQADGEWTIQGLEPGSYEIVAYRGNARVGRATLASKRVDAGEHDQALDLP